MRDAFDSLAEREPPAPRPAASRPMRVALDARKLRDPESGVGSYIVNLVRAMLRQDGAPRILLIRSVWQGPAGGDGGGGGRGPFPAGVSPPPRGVGPVFSGGRGRGVPPPLRLPPRGLPPPRG